MKDGLKRERNYFELGMAIAIIEYLGEIKKKTIIKDKKSRVAFKKGYRAGIRLSMAHLKKDRKLRKQYKRFLKELMKKAGVT